MELDEFKELLQSKESSAEEMQPAKKLDEYIRGESASVIVKIKKNIRFEYRFSIVFALFAWVGLLYPMLYVKFFSLWSVIFCILMAIYLYKLNKQIELYESSSPTVKESLTQIIYIIDRFVKLYFRFTVAMMLPIFVIGLITGSIDVLTNKEIKNFNWTRFSVYYIVFFIFWGIFMYFFAKWYIRKLYGNYLNQLKSQLKDLENG